MGARLHIMHAGLLDYAAALDLQQDLHRRRVNGEIPDTLLLLEHPPVITRGRRTDAADLLVEPRELARRGVGLFDVERGGQATYHGPGQLVGYPIVHLAAAGGSVKKLVWNIEQVLIDLARDDYGLPAVRDPEHRGVWVGTEKLAAIGLAVRRRVTFHGFALNVDVDLEGFKLIVPCGLRGRGVTSLAGLLGRPVGMQEASEALARRFAAFFSYDEAGAEGRTAEGDER